MFQSGTSHLPLIYLQASGNSTDQKMEWAAFGEAPATDTTEEMEKEEGVAGDQVESKKIDPDVSWDNFASFESGDKGSEHWNSTPPDGQVFRASPCKSDKYRAGGESYRLEDTSPSNGTVGGEEGSVAEG
eukprot:sb/3475131/